MGNKSSHKQIDIPQQQTKHINEPILIIDEKQAPTCTLQRETIRATYYHPYSSFEQQTLLIYGYIREYYNKFIPKEMFTLFIMMIGKYNPNKFKWFITGDDLSKILSNPNNTDVSVENNKFEIYKLQSFSLFVDPKIYKSIEVLWFYLQFPSYKSKYLKRKRKTKKSIYPYQCVVTMFIEEINYKIIDFKYNAAIKLSKIDKLNSLNFGFIIDVISMEAERVNMAYNKLLIKYFYNDIKMNQNMNKKWIINGSVLPSSEYIAKQYYSVTYYSEMFNNNNFMLIFEKRSYNFDNVDNPDVSCSLVFYVKCLRFPFGIESMTMSSSIKVQINNEHKSLPIRDYSVSVVSNSFCVLTVNMKEKFCLDMISVDVNIKICKIRVANIDINDKSLWKYYGILIDDKELFLEKSHSFVNEYETIFDEFCVLEMDKNGGNNSFIIDMVRKDFRDKISKQAQEIQLLKNQIAKIRNQALIE